MTNGVTSPSDESHEADARARNPAWAVDELLLALDLYLRHRPQIPDGRHPDVVALSSVLNALPIHTVRPDLEKFRNVNGVAMKLANFAAVDPAYPGKGLDAGGRRDAEVWDRWHDRRDELEHLAMAIRAGATSAAFPAVPEDGEEAVPEGRLLYRRHRTRERNAGVVERKKRSVLASGEALACEACGFDFGARYGELGEGYIECHHLVPLGASGATTTRLRDLALLCANCHRMIHRARPWKTVPELRYVLDDHVP